MIFNPIYGSGGSSPSPALGTKTITANGTYNASSDNLDGYSQVTVNVSGSPNLQAKTGLSITANGSFSYTPDVGYDGLSEVSGTVNVPDSGSFPTLPSAYQRVKYLQAARNQYAQATGVTIPANSAIRIIFQSAYTTENTIIGCADSPIFECYTDGSDCPALGWSNSPVQRFTNGNLYDVQQFAIWKASTALPKMYLCCYRLSGNTYRFVGKIYRITISNSFALDWNEIGTAAYDFIPCYRKADNVAGFYEAVTGTFYPSESGTDFIAGPDA